MLKKDIRRAILEAKEKKERILIEQEIVTNRIIMVFESRENIRNFKKLPKYKRDRISEAFLQEMIYLGKTGLLNEEGFDFMGVLQRLFGGLFGRSAVETIAEPLVNKILSAVGFTSDGIMKKTVVSFLTTNPSDLIAAFSDCRKMSKLLMESFTEGLVMMLQDQFEKDSYFYDYIRNTLGGTIKDSSLENTIADKVCSLFDGFSSNAKDLIKKLSPGT
jgi:hypothetical protein